MSKKKLIAIITIIVLLFAAGISVGVFLYGRAETQATDGNQTIDQNQVSDGNQDIQGTLADGNADNSENSATNPDATDENVTTLDNEDVVGTENNETVENDNENANNEAANNNNVADNTNNTGVTTGTNVDNVGETTITRVEEEERLVSEDFLDWWQPMTVAVTPTEVGVELPQISVKKVAITEVGDAKLVYIGQDITYVIAVTNNSEIAVENIEVTDRIPENTTYVVDSIEDAVILKEVDGELTSEVIGTKATVESENEVVGVKWVVSIPAGETVIAGFTVNVNKTMLDANETEVETIGTILNTAIANGEESNEVQTSIIRTHKSSVVVRNGNIVDSKTAKVGDIITYTISIENTGDVEGTTYVLDNVPTGTAFISAQEGAKVTKSVDTTVIWSVTIPAHTTVTREFTVEVTSVDGLIKNIADVGGTPTNEDIIDTANINVVKTATAVKRAGEDEFTTPVGEVKENDIIQYTIVVTNTGSRDLTNVLLEEHLEGVEVTKLEVDGVKKEIAKDAETGKLIIGDLRAAKEATEEAEAEEAGVAVITAEYKVSYEKDIKNKGNEDGTTIPVYNKVIATGETVPNPENPNEVPEQVEDNDDETVPVAEDPRFEIIKTATEVKRVGEVEFSPISGKVKSGDIVKYEIVVTNTGNTTLTNIVVTDTLSVRIDTEDGDLKEVNPETGVSTLKTILSLVSGAREKITTYYEVDQDDMIPEKINENNEVEIDIIENIVTAKPEGLDEKQDDEIIHVNPYISRKVTKTWIGDEDNKYGTRPANITVRLYDDGVEVDAATITAESVDQEGNWSHEFTMKPKYNEDGTAIVYTITEDDVLYYDESVPTTDMQEYTITNTLNQEKISVSVTKTWVDNNNNYNTRPSQITVRLYADGNEVQVATITAESVDQDGKWNHIFTNLPKYNGLGNEIVYTISEDDISDYDEDVDGYNITNTLNPAEKTSISGTKTWLDDNDKFGARPSKITVNLMIGQNVVNRQEVTADAKGEWKYSFTNLPTEDVNGNPITYSIQEENVAYYTSEIIIPDKNNPNIVNITNELNQEYITLSGTKTWYAPSTVTIEPITVRVHQNGSDTPYKANVNGTEIEFKLDITPGEARNAGYSFGPLPKYSFTKKADGTIERTENRYEVREDKPTGFQDPVYSTITKNGNSWVQNITNRWAQEYLTITVNKNWRDLGIASSRPTIYIDLYKKVGSAAESKVATLTFNNNKTSDQFARLEKYTISPDGTTYTLNSYRVAERFNSNKYTSSGPSVTTPITSSTTVEFTNTINQEYTESITATKVWDIPEGTTGATGIRIYVYQNGNRMDNQYVDLTYGGKTSHTFTGLPKYNFKADGTVELYNYTVQEAVNAQYITTQSGNTIKNEAKGIVESITTEITTTSTSSPVDVVFVLDVSNSMKNHDRITKMRDAVNSAMSTIKNYNSSNRVGIVTFTSDNVRVKAKSIQGLTSDKNQKVAYDPNYYENGTKKGVFYVCTCSHTDVNSCTCDKSGGLTVMGATYTQTGIELGAEMLIDDNSIDKTGRTPIMILVTDGEPTVYNTNYNSNLTTLDSTGRAQGQQGSSANSGCSETNADCVYYTVRSAIYWKSQIAAEYDGLSNIFTLGIGLKGSEAGNATLNPTYANIKAYSNTLKNKFVNGGLDIVNNPNIANYADEAYLTNDQITTAELTAKLNSFINNSNKFKETSTKRMMTTSEITSKVVTLTSVDTSKPFTITCANGGPYTLETALSAGIAVQNGTTVTVYLERTGLTSQVYIRYYKK